MTVPSVIFVGGCLLVAIPVRRSSGQGMPGPAGTPSEARRTNDDDPETAVWAGQVVVGKIPREPAAFVARETVGRLADAAGGGRMAVVCALTGLRGVGKTQVAGAYARARKAEGWGLVGWVNAETRDDLLDGLRRVAEKLGVADPQGDSEESAQRLLEWLATWTGQGLLVFDNADDPDVLLPFLPATGGTQIVVTSTNRECVELGDPVDVSVYTRAESVDYLRARTRLDDEQGAGAIAEELGDLPLGLAQAAAVISRQRLTYQGYLKRLRQVPLEELLERIPGGNYPRATAAALLLSVQSTEASDPGELTSWLLRVVAALSPDGIPRSFLDGLPQTRPASRWAVPWPRRGAPPRSEVDVDKAVERCVTGSLLDWSADGDAVVMHRLVARVLRERDKARGRWTSTVTGAINLLEPLLFPEEQAWSRREDGIRLAAQIEPLREADIETRGQDLATRLRQARFWADQQLSATADKDEDIDTFTLALAERERVLGADQPDTIAARDDLARAYYEAGRPAAAIPLYEQTLAVRERLLGTDHLDTIAARDSLAHAYRAADRHAAAIRLYEQALASRERLQGADHPDTLAARDKLASSYDAACKHNSSCRHDEAITLYQQTVDSRERLQGAGHRDTLAARERLASSYESLASSSKSAGRSAEAIPLYDQARASRDRVARDTYPAKIARQEAMADYRERQQGADHPDTLAARTNLASLYYRATRFDEAIQVYEQTLASCERLLGTDHRDTSAPRRNLATSYISAGRFDEAIRLNEQTLADREHRLGLDDPQVHTARYDLARACELAGRHDQAIPVLEQSLASRERLQGADHADTLAAQDDLARFYLAAGRRAEAIRVYERILASRKRMLGTDHPETLASRTKLKRARTEGHSE